VFGGKYVFCKSVMILMKQINSLGIIAANLVLGKLDSRVRGNDNTPKRGSGTTTPPGRPGG
jgi:hypothetical protein